MFFSNYGGTHLNGPPPEGGSPLRGPATLGPRKGGGWASLALVQLGLGARGPAGRTILFPPPLVPQGGS